MDIEVNEGKQEAIVRNGKYEYTFTPTKPDEKVKIYHMGCKGTTRLSKIQLEKGDDVTAFEKPYEKANELSGVFKQIRDLDVQLRDSKSELWGKIKLNHKGLITEFQNNELRTILAATAEGFNSTVTALENSVVKKSDISITQNGIRLGTEKVIDGNTISSLLVAQPESINIISRLVRVTGDMIVNGTIEGKHIKVGSITTPLIDAKAVKARHIDIDDALIRELISNKAFIRELWATDGFIENLHSVKIRSTQIDTDTLNGVIITGASQIRIGQNGYFEPFGTGVRFVLPHENRPNSSGVGVQFNATHNALGKGLSVFNITDIQNPNAAKPIYDEVLMTVHGQIHMGFPFFDNRIRKFSNFIGSVVVSNVSNNKPVIPWGWRGGTSGSPTYSKISWLSWLWGVEGGSRIVFGYPYENNANYFAIRIGESYSDRKLKENIKPTTDRALDLVEKLQFKKFDWKKDYKETGSQKSVKVGLIAQDVQKLDDALVTKSPDILELEHFRLTMYALKSIQELSEENKILKERIEDLINGRK